MNQHLIGSGDLSSKYWLSANRTGAAKVLSAYPKWSLVLAGLGLLLLFAPAQAGAEMPAEEYRKLVRRAREVYQIRITKVEETEKSNRFTGDYICDAEVLVVERTLMNRKEGKTFQFKTYNIRPEAYSRGFVGPKSPAVPQVGWVGRIYLEEDRHSANAKPTTDVLQLAAFGRSFEPLPNGRPTKPAVLYHQVYVCAWRADLHIGNDQRVKVPYSTTAKVEDISGKYYLITAKDESGKQHRGWIRRQDVLTTAPFADIDLEIIASLNELLEKKAKLRVDDVGRLSVLAQIQHSCSTLYGRNHPTTTTALYNLAHAELMVGKAKGNKDGANDHKESAAKLLRQCIEFETDCLGEGHPTIAESMEELGDVYVELKQYEQAEQVLKQSLEIRQKTFGENDDSVAAVMNKLAIAYARMNRDEESLPIHIKALEIRRKALGNENKETVVLINNLAAAYESLKRYDEAEKLYLEGLAIRFRLHGGTHEQTKDSVRQLNNLYKLMDKPVTAMLSSETLTLEQIQSLTKSLHMP